MTFRKTVISMLAISLAAAMFVCAPPVFALDGGKPVLYAAAKKTVRKQAGKTRKKKARRTHRSRKTVSPAARPKVAMPQAADLTASGEALLDGYNGTDKALLDRAEKCFMDALAKDPGFAPAYTGLSKVVLYRGYGSHGEFDDRALTKAVALADRALELSPGSGDAYLQRGYIMFYLGNRKVALSQAEKAARAGATASALYGEIAMKAGDLSEAKARFEAALTEAGDRPGKKADAYDALGEIAMAETEFDRAAEMFKMAAALRPDSSWESSNYGLALVQSGRFDEAIEVLSYAFRRHDFPEVRANLALAYLKKGVSLHDEGDTLKAKGCYRDALEYDPGLKPAYRNLATIYRAEGDLEGVEALCRGLLVCDPGDEWARLTLGELGEPEDRL